MIRGRVEHNLVFIESFEEKELGVLRKALKFYEKKFYSSPGESDYTVISIYDEFKNAFPTGYLNKVKNKLEEKNINFKFTDNRRYKKNTYKIKQVTDFENPPREWQKKAIEESKDHHVGFISAPTASGKSRVINELILHHQVKTLVIVPSQNIQTQVANKLRKLIGSSNVSEKIPKQTNEEFLEEQKRVSESKANLMKEFLEGKRSDGFHHEVDKSSLLEYLGVEETPEEKYLKEKGHFDKTQKQPKKIKKKVKKVREINHAVTVCCYQSLQDYSIKFMDGIEMVIIDEAHHSSSVTIRKALNDMPNAAFRFGFSATPWRDKKVDMELLESALGNVTIFEYDPEKALEDEVIAAPELRVIHPAAPEIYLAKLKNWRAILEQGIIGNKVRNDLIVYEASEAFYQGKNVLICVDEISHAEILEEKFKEIELDSILIHGRKNRKLNESNIKKIGENSEEGMISIGTMSVGEGTDMPYIDVVVLASGGKSSIRFLQKIGRALRRPEGKEKALIIDFQDWFNPILLKHSLARQKIFQEYFRI